MKKVYQFVIEVPIKHADLYASEFKKIYAQTGVAWTTEESWYHTYTRFKIGILSDLSDYDQIKDRIINALGLESQEFTDERANK